MAKTTTAAKPRRHPATPPILDSMAKRVLNYRPSDKPDERKNGERGTARTR